MPAIKLDDLDRDELLFLIRHRMPFRASDRDLWRARWEVLLARATVAMEDARTASAAWSVAADARAEPGLSPRAQILQWLNGYLGIREPPPAPGGFPRRAAMLHRNPLPSGAEAALPIRPEHRFFILSTGPSCRARSGSRAPRARASNAGDRTAESCCTSATDDGGTATPAGGVTGMAGAFASSPAPSRSRSWSA